MSPRYGHGRETDGSSPGLAIHLSDPPYGGGHVIVVVELGMLSTPYLVRVPAWRHASTVGARHQSRKPRARLSRTTWPRAALCRRRPATRIRCCRRSASSKASAIASASARRRRGAGRARTRPRAGRARPWSWRRPDVLVDEYAGILDVDSEGVGGLGREHAVRVLVEVALTGRQRRARGEVADGRGECRARRRSRAARGSACGAPTSCGLRRRARPPVHR